MKHPYKVERRFTEMGWKDDWQVTNRSTGDFESAWPTRQDARKEANRLNAGSVAVDQCLKEAGIQC